jgi:dihydroxyacetone kinase-like predicted kinase
MIKHCNGKRLIKALSASNDWLSSKMEVVNNLNVFPVPDGDTGFNMSLTLKAAVEATKDLKNRGLAFIAKEAGTSSVMASRGCSGVILSQFLVGLAKGLEGKKRVEAKELAQALLVAAETTYRGVREPVEGTILTVAKGAAKKAIEVAKEEKDIAKILQKAYKKAQEVLEKTPEMLPVLKDAGVVDAGGAGFVYILEGVLRLIEGKPLEEISMVEATVAKTVNTWRSILVGIWGGELKDIKEVETIAGKAIQAAKEKLSQLPLQKLKNAIGIRRIVGTWEKVLGIIQKRELSSIKAVRSTAQRAVDTWEREIKYKYCTEFLIKGKNLALKEIENELAKHGDCAIVVGSLELAKCHIHTNEPDKVKAYAATLGEVDKVKIDDMAEQHRTLLMEKEVGEAVKIKELGIIAVSPGEGLSKILKSLGVDEILGGPKKLKPSVEDINKAIETIEVKDVILLPNDGDIILAAEKAKELSKKRVEVIPAKSIPQGLAALMDYNPEANIEENKEAMSQALGRIKTGQVAKAARIAKYKELKIRRGFDQRDGSQGRQHHHPLLWQGSEDKKSQSIIKSNKREISQLRCPVLLRRPTALLLYYLSGIK